MTTETTFLLNVPFPLMAPPSKLFIEEPAEQPQIVQNTQESFSIEETTFEAILDSLVDLSHLATENIGSQQLFCQEYGLWRIIGSIFHTAKTPSTELKIAALTKHLEPLQLPYIRVSRQSAAWIWGYIETPEHVHLDFEKSRRAATQNMKKTGIHPHQLNTFGNDETITINTIEVTTKLRTVLDVLQFENYITASKITAAFLEDTTQEIDIESLTRIVEIQKHLQNRDQCYAVLNQLNT